MPAFSLGFRFIVDSMIQRSAARDLQLLHARGGTSSVSTITQTTQYLTFKLDEEVFALDVAEVREILDFTTVTKVPQTPDFMRGVINLRGSVVPVMDLRLKFGMSHDREDGQHLRHRRRDDSRWGDHGPGGPGRLGAGGYRPGAGADRTGAPDRHQAQHRIHFGHGQAQRDHS